MTPASFDSAERDFVDFVEARGYARALRWTSNCDAFWWRGKLVVFARHPGEGRVLARAEYQRSATIGRGLLLEAVANSGDSTVCRLVAPVDETDAEQRLVPPGGVKMSAWSEPPRVILLPRLLFWLLRRMPGIDRLDFA